MNIHPKIYGVIAEFKSESTIIMEGKPMTYDEAHERMHTLAKQPHAIRVAIFKITFEAGNDSLIEKEVI